MKGAEQYRVVLTWINKEVSVVTTEETSASFTGLVAGRTYNATVFSIGTGNRVNKIESSNTVFTTSKQQSLSKFICESELFYIINKL